MLNKLEKILAKIVVGLFKISKSKITYKILSLFLLLVIIFVGISIYLNIEAKKAFERSKIVSVVGVSIDLESGIYIIQTPMLIDVNFNNPVVIQNPENIKLELNINADEKRFASFLEQPDEKTLRFKYIVHFGDEVENLNYVSEDSMLLNGAGIYNVDNELIEVKLPITNSSEIFATSKKITISKDEPYPIIIEQRKSKEVKEYTIVFNKPVKDFTVDDITIYEGLPPSNFQKVDNDGRVYKIDTAAKGMFEQTITINKNVCFSVDNNTPNSMGIIIPNDFYYVTGTKETGIVISDMQIDENNEFNSTRKLSKDIILGEGNQFVYIPVDYISNDAGKIGDEEKGSYFGRRNFGVQDDNYEDYKEDIPSELINSIKKYNGFYVGRYESSTNFNVSADGKNIIRSSFTKAMPNKVEVEVEVGRIDSKDTTQNKLYNYIDFDLANEISNNLFLESSLVTSHIPYAAEWDTIVELFSELGIKDDFTVTQWGNFYDSDILGFKINGEAKPLNAAITMQTMRFNIFDFAGNLWEITNEKIGDFIVIRGGSFDSLGKLQTTSYRKKITKDKVSSKNIGFRPFMYIK